MFTHIPVMAREAVHYLACAPGGVYVDGTLGGCGYALEILKASAPNGVLIGIDRDIDALKAAEETLRPFKDRVFLAKENFKNLRKVLLSNGLNAADAIVLDLGVSSHQLDTARRGFSFRFDARLDMRMDTSSTQTAHDLVNTLGKDELERILKNYGEERFARSIAAAIERARSFKPIETTSELARIISSAVPKRFHSKNIHPATKSFQALRIVVNSELDDLKDGISAATGALKKGGRLVVVSFHSLEDRIVKETFREMASTCVCPPRFPQCVCGKTASVKLVTKKAVKPQDDELRANPRARSARLRAIEKL
ncbi:16S rRNA (cytosine(1402)-N(4))-methyltransferase RsmH [bacterium]|nr:MAG: 16S rRNA (cytosine(1402)-N(4))-methyltransferase RsmH [bacterium]